MCGLSANIARGFKLTRCSLSPVGTDGGYSMVTSKKSSCSLATGWFICFASSERQIIISSAGHFVGKSRINPVFHNSNVCCVCSIGQCQ